MKIIINTTIGRFIYDKKELKDVQSLVDQFNEIQDCKVRKITLTPQAIKDENDKLEESAKSSAAKKDK